MSEASTDLLPSVLNMLRAAKEVMGCINKLPGGSDALLGIGFNTAPSIDQMIKDLLSSGLSQAELGEIIGVSQVRINQLVHEGGSVSYERGLRLKARHDAWLASAKEAGHV